MPVVRLPLYRQLVEDLLLVRVGPHLQAAKPRSTDDLGG
jgi:hypothetical protein